MGAKRRARVGEQVTRGARWWWGMFTALVKYGGTKRLAGAEESRHPTLPYGFEGFRKQTDRLRDRPEAIL